MRNCVCGRVVRCCPAGVAGAIEFSVARHPRCGGSAGGGDTQTGADRSSDLSNRRMLASLYDLQGRLDDATTLMQREATELMQSEGKNGINLAETLNRLALIHRKAGREREADKILAQALKIYRTQPAARRRPPPPVVVRQPRRRKRRSRCRLRVWIHWPERHRFPK